MLQDLPIVFSPDQSLNESAHLLSNLRTEMSPTYLLKIIKVVESLILQVLQILLRCPGCKQRTQVRFRFLAVFLKKQCSHNFQKN